MVSDPTTYEDETAPVDERIADLLDRMTLEEKAGQLTGLFASEAYADPYENHSLDDVEQLVGEYAVGSVTPFATGFSSHNSPAVVPRISNRLQRIAREQTRLGIPLLIPVDAIHGHANVKGATVFPHNLGMAATWNPTLVRRAARATATEMRATGATMNYSPNVDVAREPRWGRTYETYGEAPHLVGELATAEVAGLQDGNRKAGDSDGNSSAQNAFGSTGVAATVKHFPAYSAPVRGEDAAPVDVSPSTLHRIFVPPFKRTIDAGVAAVMPTYSAVNDEPAHGSRRYLTSLLRNDLGFDGVVQSDWSGVTFLHNRHQTASSPKDAASQAIQAGLDVASIGGPEHASHLCELVANGHLSEDRLEESVRRVLKLKFTLGLFDDPYVDPHRSQKVVGQREHRDLSLACARESVVLLDNDNTLPFNDPDEVLVTGPNADSLDALCGGWTVADLDTDHGTTVRDGLSSVTGDETSVVYEPGTTVREAIDLDAAADAAAEADAAVVVCGENWYLHEFGPESRAGPSDAFPNRGQLRLPDAQRRLFERVTETGTPTTLVVVAGRPLVIPDEAETAEATLAAFYPGYEGGQAIGEILTGATNPSGRLPISMPKSVAQLPLVHDHRPHPKPLGDDQHLDSYDPLFEFGHGLSYTEFEYKSIDCDADRIAVGDSPDVTVTVANRGDRAGTEVIQLYVRDIVSSRVTPVRELAGFDRVSIPAGERRQTTIPLEPSSLGVVHPDGSRTIEPGQFEVSSGGVTTSFTVVE